MHTFGMTENYFIIVEQPLSVSMMKMVKARLLKKPLVSTLKWFQDECTLIHAVCRRSGRRKFTFSAAPFFFLHVINAYETDDHIVVDICCYRDPSVLDCMYIDAMENMQQIVNYADMFRSRPLRYVLPINVPCSESYDDDSMSLSWNYCKWITNLTRTCGLEKPLRSMANMDRVFDDEGVTIEGEHGISCDNENLVKLENSQAKAYRMPSLHDGNDAVMFCVPESLCDIGCETPRINEKISQGTWRTSKVAVASFQSWHFIFPGNKYRYFYAISSDVDALNPGTVIALADTVNL